MKVFSFMAFLGAMIFALTAPSLADGFSFPSIHDHLKTVNLTEGQIYKKEFDEVPIRTEIRKISLEGRTNYIFLYPPPGFSVMTRFVPRIPGEASDKITRLALESGYRVALSSGTLCLFPEGKHETEAILSGAVSWGRLLTATEELRFRSLEMAVPAGQKNPLGVEKADFKDGRVTISCKRVPLSWLIPYLASAAGRKIRLDRPIRGHVDCYLENSEAEQALFNVLALAGRVAVTRHDRYEAIEATQSRLAGLNPHDSLGHPALGWLSVAAESLGSKDRLTPRTAARIDEALEKLRNGKYAEALEISKGLLSARKDLWEARFIAGIARASLGDYDGALWDLGKVSRIRGRDRIVDEAVKEIRMLKNFPFIKGSATFFR